MIIPGNSIKVECNSTQDLYALGMGIAESVQYRHSRFDSVIEGFYHSIFMHLRPDEIIKKIVTELGDGHHNYNDLDCDLWAGTTYSDVECVCRFIPEIIQSCDACNGTNVIKNAIKHYVLIHSNHGNGYLYHCEEYHNHDTKNEKYDLYISRLPYNLKNEELEGILKDFKEKLNKKDEYRKYSRTDWSNELVSFQYEGNTNSGIANIKTSKYSGYDLEYISDYLSCALDQD